MRGLTELARQPPGTVTDVARLAESAGLPKAFLAQIFRRLARQGVVRSQRGRAQGFSLAAPARRISARQVVEALEGPGYFERCIFFREPCSEKHPCQLHPLWRDVRPRLMRLMETTSLADLAAADTPEWLAGPAPSNSRRAGSGRRDS